MPRDRHARIRERRVALLDHIGRHVRVLRTGNAVSLAGNVPAVELHRLRPGFDLAAMVGVITDADEVNHRFGALRIHVFGMMSDEFIAGELEAKISLFKRSVHQYSTANTDLIAL